MWVLDIELRSSGREPSAVKNCVIVRESKLEIFLWSLTWHFGKPLRSGGESIVGARGSLTGQD